MSQKPCFSCGGCCFSLHSLFMEGFLFCVLFGAFLFFCFARARPHYALTLTLGRLTKPWNWFPYFCFKQAWVHGWKGFLPGQRKDSQTPDCSWPTLTLNAGFEKVRFSVGSRAHRGGTTVRVVEGGYLFFSQLLVYRKLLSTPFVISFIRS